MIRSKNTTLARSRPTADSVLKIDYYDKALTYHSPTPPTQSVTERVITIMLAEEY